MTPRERMIEAMCRDWARRHWARITNGRCMWDKWCFESLDDAVNQTWMDDRSEQTAALDALLATLPTLGLAVVPVVATEGMVKEMDKHEHRFSDVIYRTALAAAPNPLAPINTERTDK